MPKIQQEEEKKQKYEFPIYTDMELNNLNDLLTERYDSGKTKEDIDRWLMDEGALSRFGSVIISGYELKKYKVGEDYPVCDYPTKYELLLDKLSKARKKLGIKEWTYEKIMEEGKKIRELVGQMQNIIPPHDIELIERAKDKEFY